MFEHDYLMRMIMQLVEAISQSMMRAADQEGDPELAANLLEDAIGSATDLDGGVLLKLSPESIANILKVSGTDPRVVEYVGRTMLLESLYLTQAGKADRADLRRSQAYALAEEYGFSLDEELGEEAAMEAFLAEQDAKRAAAEQSLRDHPYVEETPSFVPSYATPVAGVDDFLRASSADPLQAAQQAAREARRRAAEEDEDRPGNIWS